MIATFWLPITAVVACTLGFFIGALVSLRTMTSLPVDPDAEDQQKRWYDIIGERDEYMRRLNRIIEKQSPSNNGALSHAIKIAKGEVV